MEGTSRLVTKLVLVLYMHKDESTSKRHRRKACMYASGAQAQQVGSQRIGVDESLTEEKIYDEATGLHLNFSWLDSHADNVTCKSQERKSQVTLVGSEAVQ
jgi:hypothetical protein